MPFTKENWMTLAPGGCPDCGGSSNISVQYDPCSAVEENADDVAALFMKCSTDFNPQTATAPTVAEIVAQIDAANVIVKVTEEFEKLTSDQQTRSRGYAPDKVTARTHNWQWFDNLKMITQEHRELWNEINLWAEAEQLNFGYVTQNDELFLFRSPSGKNTVLTLDDPVAPGEGVIERIQVNVSVKVNSTMLPVPFRISGLYAAVAEKANANGVTFS